RMGRVRLAVSPLVGCCVVEMPSSVFRSNNGYCNSSVRGGTSGNLRTNARINGRVGFSEAYEHVRAIGLCVCPRVLKHIADPINSTAEIASAFQARKCGCDQHEQKADDANND